MSDFSTLEAIHPGSSEPNHSLRPLDSNCDSLSPNSPRPLRFLRVLCVLCGKKISSSLPVLCGEQSLGFTRVRRCLMLGLALLLGLAFSLGVARWAQAGVADWFSSSSSDHSTPTPAQKPRTVKKAGLKPVQPKKQSAGGRLVDNLTTGPSKMVASTKSLFAAPKTGSSGLHSKTVPRKMVADKQKKPTLMQRMFAAPPSQQPLTVNEWMNQNARSDRLLLRC